MLGMTVRNGLCGSTYLCTWSWWLAVGSSCFLSRTVSLYSYRSHRVKSERSGLLAKVRLANRDYVRLWRLSAAPLVEK